MGTPEDSLKTKEKIITAAGTLFAEHGYDSVSVRDISKLAGTHHGALNYHFQNKETLYREVVLTASKDDRVTDEEKKYLASLTPEAALMVLISETINEYSKTAKTNWQSRILIREFSDPSPAFSEAIEVYYKPLIQYFAEIIGEITAKKPTDKQVLFSIISLFSQLETFCSYTGFIDATTPQLAKAVSKKKNLAAQLHRMTISLATDNFLK